MHRPRIPDYCRIPLGQGLRDLVAKVIKSASLFFNNHAITQLVRYKEKPHRFYLLAASTFSRADVAR